MIPAGIRQGESRIRYISHPESRRLYEVFNKDKFCARTCLTSVKYRTPLIPNIAVISYVTMPITHGTVSAPKPCPGPAGIPYTRENHDCYQRSPPPAGRGPVHGIPQHHRARRQQAARHHHAVPVRTLRVLGPVVGAVVRQLRLPPPADRRRDPGRQHALARRADHLRHPDGEELHQFPAARHHHRRHAGHRYRRGQRLCAGAAEKAAQHHAAEDPDAGSGVRRRGQPHGVRFGLRGADAGVGNDVLRLRPPPAGWHCCLVCRSGRRLYRQLHPLDHRPDHAGLHAGRGAHHRPGVRRQRAVQLLRQASAAPSA